MKKDIRIELTNQVLELMEKHGTDWTKPWASNCNQIRDNGESYQGINVLILAMTGKSGIWRTFKQWKKLGCKVQAGKGRKVILYKPWVKEQDDGSINVIPVMKSYTVWNWEDAEGSEFVIDGDEKHPQPRQFASEEHIEQYIANTKVLLRHGGDRAFFSPSTDFVQMPKPEDFKDNGFYYSTLAHELTHWTGHKARLDRNLGNRFGSQDYAFEELIAELGSVFLANQWGIETAPRQDHAKYLNSWIKCLKDNSGAIFKASAMAQKAVTFTNELQEAEG